MQKDKLKHFKPLDVLSDMPACTIIIIDYRTFFADLVICKHTSLALCPVIDRKIWSHLCDTSCRTFLPCSSWTGTALEFYRRFIDGLFFLWLGSREELEKFIIYVTSLFLTLKFPAEYSYETRSVNYLDMKISII